MTALVALLISCGDGSDSGLRSVSAADVDPAALASFELGGVPVLDGEVDKALEDNVEMQQAFALALNTVSVAGTASSVGTAAIEFDVTEGNDFLSARVRISDEVWNPIDGFVEESTVEIPNLRLDGRVDFRQTRIDGSLDTRGTIKFSQIKEADYVEGDYWITDGVINFDAVGRFSFSEGPNQSLRLNFEYKAVLKCDMSEHNATQGS
ncbi:MAG: hypothetical protein EA384_14685 [Spirochaetaceae bacterium]|nr:MAG: hypothetical protein EA384_14685 [Spirochaetaceae bacterium]